MKVKTGNKQTTKNLLLNIIAFGVQFVISFYISPKIVSSVGAAAYGFIGLANDFVTYASIVATVFNSVAARFIANSFYKKDFEQANKYFNSLIVANIVISGVLGLAGMLLVPNLDKVLVVPAEIVFDVKLTFALIFLSYIISLITAVFTTSTFVSNRTDIQGVRNIIQYIVRFAFIIVFLNFVAVHIYWIAAATLIATVVVAILNVKLTKKLTPELSIDLKYARKDSAFELAKAGCWMALTNISVILIRGLDLTVANLMVGDYEMGLLSISRTMPNNITAIIGTLAPIFTPVFIMYYSKNDMQGLVRAVKKSIKTMALILFVPVSGFIVFSYDFYALWQRSLSHQELMIVTLLSVYTVIQAYFNATTATMAQLSVVANKLKLPVFVSLGCGILSIGVELLLLKTTDLGLYAIVIPTTIIMILRYVLFNSIYAAWCLEQPKKIFFADAIKTWLTIPVLIAIMWGIRTLLPIDSWFDLIVDATICAVVGYLLMLILFGRDEVRTVINKIKGKAR